MARINLEEKIWMDPRLKALSQKLGSEAMAIGYVILFWRLAQSMFIKGRLVTENQFKLAGLPDSLFDCEFAVKTEHGIRAKGDKKNFGWLVERIEAGRKGGKKTAEKFKHVDKDQRTQARYQLNLAVSRGDIENPGVCEACKTEKKVEAHHPDYSKPLEVHWVCKKCHYVIHSHDSNRVPPNDINNLRVAKRQQSAAKSTLLPPSSFLLSPNSKKEEIKKEFLTGDGSPLVTEKIQRFIGAYIKAHQLKFKVRPDTTDRKLMGQLKQYAKTHPDIERACLMVQVFFQMEDKWFETKSYDFTTFLANTQKVALALDKGEQIRPKTNIEKWAEKEAAKEKKPKELKNGDEQSELFT